MPKSVKKYSLLKCKFSSSAKRLATYYAEEFLGVGKYPTKGIRQYYRSDDVWSATNAVALAHLGYELTKPVKFFLESGFDVAVHYFCDNWWHGDKDATDAMDKGRGRRNLTWFKAFSNGLLLGLLSARWEDVARVCAWVEARIRPEYMGDDFDYTIVEVYRCVAAGLRFEPLSGLKKVEDTIRKCRTQSPKLLFQTWEAARQGDQAAFAAAYGTMMEHVEANYPDVADPFAPIHWIARHQSVVALAARHLGMKLPELPPKQQAMIITRESLGLPAKRK